VRHVLVVAALAAGCGSAQHFDAAERATASSPRGDIAAEYEIGDADAPFAEVKVWAQGAYEGEVDGREVTVIEVMLEIENDGPAPVELTELKLDSAWASGVSFDDLQPFRVEGSRVARADGDTRLHAYFALPERYDPEDVHRFEVEWALRHAGGSYVQRTPFRQSPEYYFTTYPSLYTYRAPFAEVPGPLPGSLPP
jgi:hypothetical protein